MGKLRADYCNKFINWPLNIISLSHKYISMEKNHMQFDTRRARICRDIYKPSPNLFRFIKSIFAVVMIGESPITKPGYSRRK